jgi:uracil-DNA glycosylase
MAAAEYLPDRLSLPALREAVQGCRGCGLWEHATQGVLGEGTRHAELVLVGEQPGDQEDKQGKPFVGPAGRILDQALEEAGLDRSRAYVTNAVKHFKWARGQKSTRRLHRTPSATEIRACRPWLDAELALVQPRAILCLGATAAKTLLGRTFSVTRHRAEPLESEWAPVAFATVHPSAILRAPENERARAERRFFSDIERIARHLALVARQR